MDGLFYDALREHENFTRVDRHGVGAVHRLLAPDGGKPEVDYGVISIVIITLALVLAIEVFRHRLDTLAGGNPFFHTVLELMYRELTTLGIVEFFIHLLHAYWTDFNYKFEAMFVDVHFMLFYTAIFNAIQSCFVRLLSSRRTDASWVQTEDMDIDHYIHIRKEFDRLEETVKSTMASGWGSNVPPSTSENGTEDCEDMQESSCWNSFREEMRDLSFKMWHPRLYRRKKQLLLPIRFHELRAHFITSNDLPSKFQVSHYLKRSLTAVLLDFVHISPAAWILLMATANLIHFLSGILLNATRDPIKVEKFLASLFFALMVLFVAASVVLYFKMRSVFSNILRMRLTAGKKTFHAASHETKCVEQATLFWWGSPYLIIVATQYMQFGYALGLAMIATYHKDFSANYNLVPPFYLLLVLLASYLIFLLLLSVILPWYTLCTSMGQLINKDRLHETLAKLRLGEEIRRKEAIEEEKKEKESKGEIEAKKAAARTRDASDGKKLGQRSMPNSPEERNESKGMFSIMEEGSNDVFDGSVKSRSWRRCLSGGVIEMVGSDCNSLTGDPRLSSAVFQPSHIVDADMPKNRNNSYSSSADSAVLSAAASRHERTADSGRPQNRKKSLSDGVKFRKTVFNGSGRSSPSGGGVCSSVAGPQHGYITDGGKPQRRERSLSDGVHFMKNVAGSSGCGSPTGSVRLSAVASQHMLVADDEQLQLDISVQKHKAKLYSRDSFAQPGHSQERHTFSKSNLDTQSPWGALNLTAVSPPEKGVEESLAPNLLGTVSPPPAMPTGTEQQPSGGPSSPGTGEVLSCLKDPTIADADASDTSRVNNGIKKDAGAQSSDMLGKERVLEIRQFPRQRSYSADGAATVHNVNEADVSKLTYSFACSSLNDRHMAIPANTEQARNIVENEKVSETGRHTRQRSSSTLHTNLSLERARRNQKHPRQKTQSDGLVSMMRSSLPTETVKGRDPEKLETLSKLSHMSTENLPESVLGVSQRARSSSRQDSHLENTTNKETEVLAELQDLSHKVPRRRLKSVSEGVGSMRALLAADSTTAFEDVSAKNTAKRLKDINKTDRVNIEPEWQQRRGARCGRRERVNRQKCLSESVAFMQSSLHMDPIKEREPAQKLATLSELSQMSTKALPDSKLYKLPRKVDIPGRSQRRKAYSAGVGSMRGSLTAGGMTSDVAGTGSIDVAVANRQTTKSAENTVIFLHGKSGDASAVNRNLDIHDSFSIDSDDGESDIDDVPDAHPSGLETIARKVDLVKFFQGSRYRIISFLFGPMACFFFVAMRVQIFNIYAGVFIDQTAYESFNMTGLLTPSFWIEVSLYCVMIVEMLTVLVVFLSKRGCAGALFSGSAAVFGLLISVMCLLLLLIAETKRTCLDNENTITRLLAQPEYHNDPQPECNPKFGERNHDLGIIEPFCSLIALSPLRFFLAFYVVRMFGSGQEEKPHKKQDSHHHDQNATSKVRDLWMASIGAHSNIAGSFGLFSAELLQCMLGVYVEPDPEKTEPNECPKYSEKSMDAGKSSGEEMHPNLPVVKHLSDASTDCLDAPIRDGRCDDRFAYPNARLLRRMRRCEMRLLPLVNEWEIIDAVITKHELVLFDVQSTLDVDALRTCTKNGGKRMRLCSVAKGRKVMDKFNLDDVNFVDIEHRTAIQDGTDVGDIEINCSHLLEYWEGGNCVYGDHSAIDDALNKRWGNVNEDRLKIRFKCAQMTLVLRFMTDLKHMETKVSPDLMNHVGRTAEQSISMETKLWCRTIARLRGANNLKQNLPHFGNDSNNEMEDFIEICERDIEGGNQNTHKIRKKVHRRFASSQSLLTLIHEHESSHGEASLDRSCPDSIRRKREGEKER